MANSPNQTSPEFATGPPKPRPRFKIAHFGPTPDFAGGMSSVLRVYRDGSVGGDVAVVPTWVPGTTLQRAKAAVRGVLGVLRLERGQIVHVHLSQRGSFVREGAIMALARLRGYTTVATIHGSTFVAFGQRHPRLVRAALGQANAVTCLTDDAVSLVKALLPPGAKVEVVPNPVEVDWNAPRADTTGELVVFGGEVGHRKGADVLAEAWPAVRAARPGARCQVVGPPTEMALPPLEGLSVEGPVPHREMRSLIRAARVVVLPSRAEAMPMLLLESLAARRPFVATSVGSVAELSVAGSALVPVGDAPALAREIIRFLSDVDFAADVGDRGQQWCSETRGVEYVSDMLEALYAELCES